MLCKFFFFFPFIFFKKFLFLDNQFIPDRIPTGSSTNVILHVVLLNGQNMFYIYFIFLQKSVWSLMLEMIESEAEISLWFDSKIFWIKYC